MSEWRWSKMPVSWQLDPEMHKTIARASQGEAIAALKLYIGFCLKANYGEKDGLPKKGCVRISLSQLEALTDLSRPMVVAGLKLLKEWDIVTSLGGRPAIYHIIEYETTKTWAKLTNRPLYGAREMNRMRGLESMPNRHRTTLHALQVYLYLGSIRNKDTNRAQVGYKQMCAVLGMPRNRLSAAISMLSAELITVRTAPVIRYEEGERHSTNHYWLRGSLNDPHVPSPEDFSPHPLQRMAIAPEPKDVIQFDDEDDYNEGSDDWDSLIAENSIDASDDFSDEQDVKAAPESTISQRNAKYVDRRQKLRRFFLDDDEDE